MHVLSEEFEDKLLRIIDNRFEDFLKAISKHDVGKKRDLNAIKPQ